MTSPWFHVPQLPEPGGVVLLDKNEAKHATGARRLGVGDEIVVFDGRGTRAIGRIGGRAERGDLEVEVGEHHRETPEAPVVELAASLPKGDRLGTMLDMATQLGIARFTPLKCDFSVISMDRKRQDPTERWARIMLEACKQSRRATLPEIGPESTMGEVIENAAARGAAIVVGDAEGDPMTDLLRTTGHLVILVGPEGGFSPPEQQLIVDETATGRVHRVAVGRGVLRVETAATALLAAIRGR